MGKEGVGFAKDLHTLLQAGSMGRLPAGARSAEQSWSQGEQFAQRRERRVTVPHFRTFIKGGYYFRTVYLTIPTKNCLISICLFFCQVT